MARRKGPKISDRGISRKAASKPQGKTGDWTKAITPKGSRVDLERAEGKEAALWDGEPHGAGDGMAPHMESIGPSQGAAPGEQMGNAEGQEPLHDQVDSLIEERPVDQLAVIPSSPAPEEGGGDGPVIEEPRESQIADTLDEVPVSNNAPFGNTFSLEDAAVQAAELLDDGALGPELGSNEEPARDERAEDSPQLLQEEGALPEDAGGDEPPAGPPPEGLDAFVNGVDGTAAHGELLRLRAEYAARCAELQHTLSELTAVRAEQGTLHQLLEQERGWREALLRKEKELSAKADRLDEWQERLEERTASWQPERVAELELANDALERKLTVLERAVRQQREQIESLTSSLAAAEKDTGAYWRQQYDELKAAHDEHAEMLLLLEGEEERLRKHAEELRQARTLLQKNSRLAQENATLSLRVHELEAGLNEGLGYKALWERSQTSNQQLQEELNALTASEKMRAVRSERAFDALAALLQEQSNLRAWKSSIKDWGSDRDVVRDVQKLARERNFEFSEQKIRAFLGAMRSSRLIILKGFSGTGKTSLPILFARAIGAPCEVIPVQPSWRSKVDLLGFFNHFEHRFLPTQFTRALLKAQLPAFENRHYFIVLDEMNLARVEYYFNDFNVKLQDPNDPYVELFEHTADDIRLSQDAIGQYIRGNQMRIPRNITFIGTINDDETTFSISDKVYDRAQVIDFTERSGSEEMKRGRLPTERELSNQYPPLAFSSYLSIWKPDGSPTSDMKAIEDFLGYINSELHDRFGLNLSYRPRAQIHDFVRAYTMGGGSVSEALDLQIVSKVLPKLRYSHRPGFAEHIEQFGKTIEEFWPFRGLRPSATIAALDTHRRQMG